MTLQINLSTLNQQVNETQNWRNIQDIVRSTFKLLNEVIQQQNEVITRLEREKVSKIDHENDLKQKSDAADVDARFDAVGELLDSKAPTEAVSQHLSNKANLTDLQTLSNDLSHLSANTEKELQQKISLNTLNDLLSKKADRSELQLFPSQIDLLTNEVSAKANIRDVAREMETKANVNDVNAALDTKADKADMEEKLDLKASRKSVMSALKHKANAQDVEELQNTRPTHEQIQKLLQKKADADFVQQALETRPDKKQLDSILTANSKQLEQRLREEMKHQEEAIGRQTQQASLDSQQKEQKQNQAVRELRNEILGKIDRNEMSSMKDELVQSQNATALAMSKQIDENLAAIQRRFLEQTQTLGASLGDRPTKTEIANTLANKLDRSDFLKEMNSRVSQDDLAAKLNKKADIDDVQAALALKANLEDLKRLNEQTNSHRSHIRQLEKDMETKAPSQAIEEITQAVHEIPSKNQLEQIMQNKADTSEVRALMNSIQKEVAQRATINDLRQSVLQQNAINETLCGEQCVGRWVWRSGKLKQNSHVPWNVQVANSSPDIYLWEKDRSTIVIVQPGLYELTFGFYARKKPSIQIMVNGDAILSAVNTASYVVHHSSGRLLSIGQHPSGNVTGLTMIDFIALPPNAKMCVSYSGEDKAEGFIGLKKLC